MEGKAADAGDIKPFFSSTRFDDTHSKQSTSGTLEQKRGNSS
jgi:hypothetical protein